MSHLIAFCLKVAQVVRVGRRFDGNLLNDGQTVGLEAYALLGIIGQKSHLAQTLKLIAYKG